MERAPLLGNRSRATWLGIPEPSQALRGPHHRATLSGILAEIQLKLEAQRSSSRNRTIPVNKAALPSQSTPFLRHEFLLLLWAHAEHNASI